MYIAQTLPQPRTVHELCPPWRVRIPSEPVRGTKRWKNSWSACPPSCQSATERGHGQSLNHWIRHMVSQTDKEMDRLSVIIS